MRTRGLVGLVAAGLLLVGCGGSGGGEETTASATSTSSSTAASTTTAPTLIPEDVDYQLAATLCSSGLTEPDELVLDAANGANAGTRNAEEVAAAFQEAQDLVDELADQAEADYPNLTQALQGYADALGRARVVGDVGVGEIATARENVNTACLLPALPPQTT